MKTAEPKSIALAGASGKEVFEAAAEAEKELPVRFLLLGDRNECQEMAKSYGMEPLEIIHCEDDTACGEAAVAAVLDGKADLLMKGLVSTPKLLRPLVQEKRLFPQGKLLHHLMIAESPEGRLLGISDGGMNIVPDLEQKEQIARSCIEIFHRLGVSAPKLALLSANEKPNPKIPGSDDALELCRRWKAGGFPESIIEGPVSLDIALFPRAAQVKSYGGRIQGDADILLVPDINSGNFLGKSLVSLASFSAAGLICGADLPLILLSRSDGARERYYSVLLALFLSMSPGD